VGVRGAGRRGRKMVGLAGVDGAIQALNGGREIATSKKRRVMIVELPDARTPGDRQDVY